MVMGLNVLDTSPGQYAGRFSTQRSGCNPSSRCGNGLEKIYPTCAVRYGYMGYIGEFRYAPGQLFACGGKVVVQTNRGVELGEQVSLTCTGCDKSIPRDQVLQYAKRSGPEFYQFKAGRILRAATEQDIAEAEHLNQDAARKLIFAREQAAQLGLNMKFVTCEHLLGGERLIFHFMSEDRVDFREFVRLLAKEYHTRIEMHQVGARDEARLVADYEICGRECCCKNFLKKLRQVNMKMAKLQKATLDPSKVSGRCGRLRCCLRYEHEGYEELNKKLPRGGSRIRTERGIATVRDRQILTQLLMIEYDDTNEQETIGVEDVLERGLPRRPAAPPVEDARPGARTEKPARRGREPLRSSQRPARPARPAKAEDATARDARAADAPSEPVIGEAPPTPSAPEDAADGFSGIKCTGADARPAEARPRRRGRRGRGRRGNRGPGSAPPHPDNGGN